MRLLFAALLLSTVLPSGAGCAATPQWRSSAEMRAPDRAVASALGDSWRGPRPAFDPAALPAPPEPVHLRPCCAFGADLKVHVGIVIVPGFALDNMRGLAEVGPHHYNVRPFQSSSSSDPDALADENNGLLYTCRGGFLDLAHVRDCADLTVHLAARIERLLDTGGTIDLAPMGGSRRIVLKAIDPDRLEDSGRRSVAVALAQWLAFQLSVWHEIATWYGYSSMSTWPEKISAFTPEDLYSNLLGIRIAGGILAARDSSDEGEYNNAMNAWLAMTLKRLEVTTKDAATAAIYAVDGLWWDSQRRVPDWQLVKRRTFRAGPSLEPWLVTAAFEPGHGPAIGCEGSGPPLRLRNPASFAGVPFTHDAELQVEVDDQVTAGGLPFPRKASRRLSQADFPALLEKIRHENAIEFGPGHDRPGA